MAWDDIVTSDSCITPDEWNDMITAIKSADDSCPTNAKTTFTIWSNCAELSGQKFKFDYSGDDSRIYGGESYGDDLLIYANSSDPCPVISMAGAGDIILDSHTDIYFKEQGTQVFEFAMAGNYACIRGIDTTQKGMWISANDVDTYPLILMAGLGDITLDSNADILFKEQSVQMLKLSFDGTDSLIQGPHATGRDLQIKPNSTDAFPLLLLEGLSDITLDSYADVYFKEQGTQVFKFSLSGDDSVIDGNSAALKNIRINANDTDAYPYVFLEGAGAILLDTHADIYFNEQELQVFKMALDGVWSYLYGGDDAGDEMRIVANSSDTYPRIDLLGAGNIVLNSHADIEFQEQNVEFFKFYDDAIDFKGDRAIYINTDETYVGHGAGDDITSGLNNTAVGNNALVHTTEGHGSVAAGMHALADVTTGGHNTAVGYYSGGTTSVDSNNCVYLGYESGKNNTQSNIVAIGYQALENNSGAYNTAVGYLSMSGVCTGAYNTSFGYNTLLANTSGYGNVAAGYESMPANTTGLDNTATGLWSLKTNTTGNHNTAFGRESGGAAAVDIDNCVYVGYQAGINNTQSNIVAIGYQALENNSGDRNTAVGYAALDAACTGGENTACGYEAGTANTSGTNGIFIGRRAGYANTEGSSNVFVGSDCGYDITTGEKNTIIGQAAGFNTDVDIDNCVLVGYQAGGNNTANSIVAIGYQTLTNNSGDYNTAVGHQSLDAACTGNNNTAVGYLTGTGNTSGYGNTFIGNTTGAYNTEGHSNTFIGDSAGLDNVTGNTNVAIGKFAGENALVSGCIYLGYDAGSDNTTANALYINNNNSAYPLIYGDFANDKVKFGDNNAYWFAQILHENSGGQLFLKECTTPTAQAGHCAIYTKADNKLYVQTGDGVEHEVTIS